MNLRHAAALALVGWYLMLPPPTPDGVTNPALRFVESDAPLSKWSIQRSYDTAESCEKAKEKAKKAARQAIISEGGCFDSDRSVRGRIKTTDEITTVDALCIASDDQRLKEK